MANVSTAILTPWRSKRSMVPKMRFRPSRRRTNRWSRFPDVIRLRANIEDELTLQGGDDRCEPRSVIRHKKVEQHNILISSGGRRIGLANCFRESLKQRGGAGWVGTIDSGPSAPLSFLADKTWRVPKCTEPQFVDSVLGICREHRVELIVPTTDRELDVWVQNQSRLASLGISVALSAPETVAIAW